MPLPPPSPWIPEGDKIRLAVLGKFAEELAECFEAATSMSQFGSHTHNSEQVYGRALVDEIADVLAGVRLVCDEFYDGTYPRVVIYASRQYGEFMVALARCSAATARCIVQGFEGNHPVTERPNSEWLWAALADVISLGRGLLLGIDADHKYVAGRMAEKVAHKKAWHELIRQHEASRLEGDDKNPSVS